jgi:hypothetical protein
MSNNQREHSHGKSRQYIYLTAHGLHGLKFILPQSMTYSKTFLLSHSYKMAQNLVISQTAWQFKAI